MSVLGELYGVTHSLDRKMRKTPCVEQTPGLTAGKPRNSQEPAGACPEPGRQQLLLELLRTERLRDHTRASALRPTGHILLGNRDFHC